MSVRVRLAVAAELAAVGELTEAAYRGDGLLDGDPDGGGYGDELRDAAARAAVAHVLVAVADPEDGSSGSGGGAGAGGAGEEVLGTVTVVRPPSALVEMARPDEVEVRMLAVSPSARGRGVGEALVRAAMGLGAERGARGVVLCSMEAMTTAHRLYDRLGFVRAPERDWQPRPGLTLLAYVTPLGPAGGPTGGSAAPPAPPAARP